MDKFFIIFLTIVIITINYGIMLEEDKDGDLIPDLRDAFPDNPCEAYDTDKDGIGDNEDLDADNDQFSDFVEILNHTNPKDANSFPKVLDTDGDGLEDEIDSDDDNDLVSDQDEITKGSNHKDPFEIPGFKKVPKNTCVLKNAPGWYKGDFHNHTYPYSDDAMPLKTVEHTIKNAEAVGLDFLEISDHRTIEQHFDPYYNSSKLILISGMEAGGPSHVNPIGTKTLVPTNLLEQGNAEVEQIIKRLHAQRGVFSVNHPLCKPFWYYDVDTIDAVEVWNAFWQIWPAENPEDYNKERPGNPQVVEALSSDEKFANEEALIFWELLLEKGLKIPALSGSDNHYVYGKVVGAQEFPVTYVYAQELSEDGIIEGIRQGRTYISRSVYGPKISFVADGNNDKIYESSIGDTISIGGIKSFKVEISNFKNGFVEVIKNRQILKKVKVLGPKATVIFTDTPNKPSWYRINLRDTGINKTMLALTSPIYVE